MWAGKTRELSEKLEQVGSMNNRTNSENQQSCRNSAAQPWLHADITESIKEPPCPASVQVQWLVAINGGGARQTSLVFKECAVQAYEQHRFQGGADPVAVVTVLPALTLPETLLTPPCTVSLAVLLRPSVHPGPLQGV